MKDKPITYWYFTDILSEQDCDNLIAAYDNDQIKKEKSTININNEINCEFRNSEKVMISPHKGIGALLSGVGLCANYQAWNFDIKYANQCEFLKYTVGGKFEPHIDNLMNLDEKECRKLTVLAILNDNFKGGKFFIQDGAHRGYVIQKKGTILVFPSFILHGVEQIEEGIRYSIVTWLVGPPFK